MMKKKTDKIFLILITILTACGFLIFSSASLGLLSRADVDFIGLITSKQLLVGVMGGGLACFIAAQIKYQFWHRNAFYIFLFTIILTSAVFIPGLGFEHNGAKRWLDVGFVSFEPSEFLKYGYIIYLAAWFANKKKDISDHKFGLIPFCIITGIVGTILILQPDTDTLAVMVAAGVSIYIVSGAKLKDLFILGLIGIVVATGVVFMKPYIMERIKTFFDPSQNSQSSGYQIQQSLIAIGSGGITGKGFGQSIQKFGFLPEPVGDSIFAVAAEEFGFIGATMLVMLFVAVALRGMRISSKAPDRFGSLLALGIIMVITAQSFMNMMAMLAIIPLSGQTLPLVSHGGTSLLVALGALGIVCNISKFQRR